jgi:transcriptional regulator with XRE-family HTH domain
MNLGKNIQYYRQKLGLSQVAFASKLNVAQSTAFRWEANISKPSVELLVPISKVLNTSPDKLLLSTGEIRKLNSNNTNLAKRLNAIENLNHKDQQALIQIIDAFLKSKK